MGILVGLGQDTNELTGEKSWWEKIPSDRNNKATDSENLDSKQDKFKDLVDPLNTVRRYLGTEGVQSIIKKSRKEEEKSLKLCENKKKKDKYKHKEKHKHKDKHKKKKKKRYSNSSSDESEKRRKSTKKKRKRYSSSSSAEDSRESELEKIKKQQKLEKLRLGIIHI